MTTHTTKANRLLVVDDDLSFVTFVCEMLDKVGVPTEVALTGNDGIRRTKTGTWSGVLLDLNLPDIHGLEVLRDIRGQAAGIPVVVLTGAGSIPAAVEAMRLGALDFLEKPVDMASLTSVVDRLLAHGRTSIEPGADRLIDQLAIAMNAVVQSPADVPTVRGWCATVGKSESSLYALCEVVHVSAKGALDLARLLRAARFSGAEGLPAAIHAADPRTITRLLRRAGVTASMPAADASTDLLEKQQLIAAPRLVERLVHHIHCEQARASNLPRLEKIP